MRISPAQTWCRKGVEGEGGGKERESLKAKHSFSFILPVSQKCPIIKIFCQINRVASLTFCLGQNDGLKSKVFNIIIIIITIVVVKSIIIIAVVDDVINILHLLLLHLSFLFSYRAYLISKTNVLLPPIKVVFTRIFRPSKSPFPR